MASGLCPDGELLCSILNSTTLASNTWCIPEPSFTCREFQRCECPPIHADPDIAGRGMIAAFEASATLVLLSLMLCLLLHPSNILKSSNPFDQFFRKRFSTPIQHYLGASKSETWSNSLFALIMAISDQQIITGIAILAAAINSNQHQLITVYHFNIITDMGWFSSNVHLMALCVMRHYLDFRNGDFISQSKAMSVIPRTLRILFMITMAILLLYCATVSGYELWFDKQNCPALCVRGGKRAGAPFRQMIVTWVFVVQSYTVQIIRVIPPITKYWSDHGIPWLINFDTRMANRVYGRKIQSWLYSTAREVAVVFFYFFTSDFEFMLEMITWYALGLYWTFTDRAAGHKMMRQEDIRKENHVGFGQLVPMLLVTLALLSMVEAYICRPGVMEHSVRKQQSLWSLGADTIDLKNLEDVHNDHDNIKISS